MIRKLILSILILFMQKDYYTSDDVEIDPDLYNDQRAAQPRLYTIREHLDFLAAQTELLEKSVQLEREA